MSASQPDQAASSSSATGAAGGSSISKSAARRKRQNRKRKENAENASVNSGSSSSASHSQHSHGHDHGHGGHGHDHGHGHGHSHDGVPCGGHGANIGDPFGEVTPDEIKEAQHYCDVLWHYQSYRQHTFARLERLHSDFQIQPTILQKLVPTFEDRMSSLRRAVIANYQFIQEILAHRYVFQNSPELDYDALEEHAAANNPVDEERMGRVRSTIRQCVRDWSAEGKAERDACYGPILRELERLYPDAAKRENMRVLVPGSGLGRFVWEVASRGFFAQGNEFSYYMLLCCYLILNCCKEKNIFTIYPWVSESKNLLSPEDALRPVQIPDVNPTQLGGSDASDGSSSSAAAAAATPQGKFSMVAGDWMDIFSDLPQDYLHGMYRRKLEKMERRHRLFQQKSQEWQKRRAEKHARIMTLRKAGKVQEAQALEQQKDNVEEEVDEVIPDPPRGVIPESASAVITTPDGNGPNKESWDVVTTCFFIDCAQSILEFLRTIAYILKPNGHWINFGPLLYHYSDVPGEVSVDLTWAELRKAIPYLGLTCVREELNVPCSYTSDDRSMMRNHYYCVSATFVKTGADRTREPMSIPPQLEEPVTLAWNQSLVASNGASGGAAERNNIVVEQESKWNPFLLNMQAVLIRAKVELPNKAAVSVWSIPQNQLANFLLKATSDANMQIGKIVVEGVELLAVLKKA